MPRILQSMAVAAKGTERNVYILKCMIMFYDGIMHAREYRYR